MASEPSWLLRSIEWYSNTTDELIGEAVLPPLNLADLQKLWGQPASAPMVEMFEVEYEEQVAFLQELADVEFDFAEYSYFISAATLDWDATKQAGGYRGLYPPPRSMPLELTKVMPKTPSDS